MTTADDDLLQWDRWAQGDATAGNALVRRYFTAVFRFFDRRVPQVAEELTQATFLACVEHRDRFRREATVRSFLFGIARLQLLRCMEGRGIDQASLYSQVSVPDSRTSPSRAIDRAHAERAVQEAIGRLPLEQQLLLELYYWESLSLAELSQVFDVPRGTLKSRLFRARDALRNELETGGNAGLLDGLVRGPS